MANSVVADPSAPPSNAAVIVTTSMDDLGDPLLFPPMDPDYLFQIEETLIDDVDFSFDDYDFDLPSDVDSFLDPNFLPGYPACYLQPELRNHSPPELSLGGSRVLNLELFESPESNGCNQDSQESGNGNCGSSHARVLSCPSPESQSSGNCGSNVSAAPNSLSKGSNQSVNSSPGFEGNSIKIGVVDHNFKLEGTNNNIYNYSNSVLKRKKEDGESNNVKLRMSKCRKSIDISNMENTNTNTSNVISEEEEKKNARLLRNRESAQLSRQRKKHYVEELEGKVRTMHSTIQELNAKISYVMAENASLRQQMAGSGVGMAPPPGMYPPVMYPWMPYTPPYMVKPQGSQVPLIPIPKLKPKQAVSVSRTSKKVEGKKKEAKNKKLASVTFLGLLFFIFMFGGLLPMVNVRFGGTREAYTGGNYAGNGFYEKNHGMVLAGNGTSNSLDFGHGKHFSDGLHYGKKDHNGGEDPSIEHGEIVCSGNGSEPLAASLYVPRNDKLVKIDGNLIIHSVLASEKAMASRGGAETKSSEETSLAIPGDLTPAKRHPHMYQGPAEHPIALGPGTIDRDNKRLTGADGKLQQWFQEGLAGPMLSSGMCTEVFQFDISSAIIPATSTRNVSIESSQNTTNSYKGKNRRILHSPIPISASSQNMSEENVGRNGHTKNNTVSPMVVSVLVDPREMGDADGESMMGTKSLSRIFVVVLIDSVKYVTYSCMLPFKGSVFL
ncbi:PREDICTED: bZIP transcription factor 17-like isoform X2 [Ipomoea nil]|uniref:bZIP transcription factor 17-like isoform X2 n=1 Tax=Ipomoea nil TaxID=35883 RepID=UPI0009015B1C|nr:PREDICTED: bZIP transcription factor 17-like isoform X2 [Ipomoea nil]